MKTLLLGLVVLGALQAAPALAAWPQVYKAEGDKPYQEGQGPLAVDRDGTLFALTARGHLLKFTPGGDLVWDKTLPEAAGSSKWLWVSERGLTLVASSELRRLDRDGNTLAVGKAPHSIQSLVALPDDSFWVAFSGNDDGHTAGHYDSDLHERAVVSVPTIDLVYFGMGLAASPDGSAYLTGRRGIPEPGGPKAGEIGIVKLASDGAVLWKRAYRGTYLHNEPSQIAVDRAGDVWINLESKGYQQNVTPAAFVDERIVLKLHPDGTPAGELREVVPGVTGVGPFVFSAQGIGFIDSYIVGGTNSHFVRQLLGDAKSGWMDGWSSRPSLAVGTNTFFTTWHRKDSFGIVERDFAGFWARRGSFNIEEKTGFVANPSYLRVGLATNEGRTAYAVAGAEYLADPLLKCGVHAKTGQDILCRAQRLVFVKLED